MTIRRGAFNVTNFKALPNGDPSKGKFEALVAIFGNVDLQGDKVMPGAFTKSIEQWRSSGDPIPVIWSHDWGNLDSHIGVADPKRVEEMDDGLRVVGEIDLDDPKAAKVHRLLKERRVKEFSFAYRIRKEKQAGGINELHELDIIEVGPTLKGANPETRLLAAKDGLIPDAHEKGGRGVASDDSEWDGDAAVSAAANSDDPAQALEAICAGEKDVGERDQAQHWALPHHRAPGRPANARAVANARARFNQTEGLANRDTARRHLFEVHRLPSEIEESSIPFVGEKAGRVISKANEAKIRSAVQALREVLSSLGEEPEEEKSVKAEANGKARDEDTLRLFAELESVTKGVN